MSTTPAPTHDAAPGHGPVRGPADVEGRVLVIDDDPDVGTTIARLLKPLPVVFAQSAAGALGRIQGGGRFSAIVCDVCMPGMDGFELYEQVHACDPALAARMLFVTGADGSRRLTEFLQRTGCRCVSKPFGRAELKAALDALARSST